MPRPRVVPASTLAAHAIPARRSASPTSSTRGSRLRQHQATRTTPLPSGTFSETPSTTQPCPLSARKNAETRTGLRRTGLKWSRSPRPREKHCWTTSRNPALALATLSKQLEARPSRAPAAAPMSTGNPSAPGSKPPPTGATPEGCTRGSKLPPAPRASKTAPLKSKSGETITDQSQQLQRWVEHYLELYARQNIVTDTALNALPSLPVVEELDDLPTEGELSKAIDSLACGKAPGKDGIPPELLKQGKSTLLQPLHKLLCLCWEHMRDANIVTHL